MRTVTKNRRGFTIVEAVVALAILVLGLAFVYQSMIDSSRIGRQRGDQMQLEYLARQRLAELRVAPAGSPASLAEMAPLAMGEDAVAETAAKPRPDGALDVTVRVVRLDAQATLTGVVAP